MDWGVLKLEIQAGDTSARKAVVELVRERWKLLEDKTALSLLPSQLRLLEAWDGSMIELLGTRLAGGFLRRETQNLHPMLNIEFREMEEEEFARAEQALKDLIEHQ